MHCPKQWLSFIQFMVRPIYKRNGVNLAISSSINDFKNFCFLMNFVNCFSKSFVNLNQIKQQKRKLPVSIKRADVIFPMHTLLMHEGKLLCFLFMHDFKLFEPMLLLYVYMYTHIDIHNTIQENTDVTCITIHSSYKTTFLEKKILKFQETTKLSATKSMTITDQEVGMHCSAIKMFNRISGTQLDVR